MKKLLLSMAALTALAGAAAPAAAQSWRGDDDRRYDDRRYDDRYDRDRYDGGGYSDRLGRQIERAQDRRQISQREAWRLRAALQSVDDLERRYRDDGRLSGWEQADLNRRKDRIAQQLDMARGDRDYGYRDDWRR